MHAIFKQLNHIDTILALSENLQGKQFDPQMEAALRHHEKSMVTSHIHLMIECAKAHGLNLVEAARPPTSISEACVLRYIYVPIFYKLGFIQEAAFYNQVTFELLFPALHYTIINGLNKLYGTQFELNCQSVIKQFNIAHEAILKIQTRIKSTNSIWKKLDTTQLSNMSQLEFCQYVPDWVGVRWIMKVNESENRYDALINGARLVNLNDLCRFKNQLLPQHSGFDSEPVMKFLFIQNEMPCELQLFGGDIELFLVAKGYTNHKAYVQFYPQAKDLNSQDASARLGMCLKYSESGNKTAFHELMLKELVGVKPNYDAGFCFNLDERPLKPSNLQFTLPFHDKPLYQTANFQKKI